MIQIVTIFLAINLMVISAVSAIFSPGISPTMFIPAVFGVIIAIASIIALRNPAALKHAMHTALGAALVGFVASASRVSKSWAKFQAVEGASPMAFYAQLSMAVVCLLILVIGIGSFVKVRLDRRKESVGEG